MNEGQLYEKPSTLFLTFFKKRQIITKITSLKSLHIASETNIHISNTFANIQSCNKVTS